MWVKRGKMRPKLFGAKKNRRFTLKMVREWAKKNDKSHTWALIMTIPIKIGPNIILSEHFGHFFFGIFMPRDPR